MFFVHHGNNTVRKKTGCDSTKVFPPKVLKPLGFRIFCLSFLVWERRVCFFSFMLKIPGSGRHILKNHPIDFTRLLAPGKGRPDHRNVIEIPKNPKLFGIQNGPESNILPETNIKSQKYFQNGWETIRLPIGFRPIFRGFCC